MDMKLSLGGWLAAGLLITLFSGGAIAQSGDVLDIRIGAAAASDHAPVFVGVEKGIFAKHGLNAKVVLYPTGVEMINGLLADAQEVNVMGSIPYLAGVANGLPLVLIGHLQGNAPADNYSTGHGIVAGPNSGIESVPDLVGKRVGLPRGTGAEGYLIGVMQAEGLSADKATLINLKPADLPTALAQGQVDAIAGWEQWPSAAIVKVPGAKRIASGGCPTCYIPAAILTTGSVIQSKPEVLERFMAAFYEAQQWVRNNYDEAAEINMRWVPGIELDVMKEAIRQTNYDGRLSANTRESYMSKTIPSLVAAGNVPKPFDPAAAIDPQFYLAVEAQHPEFFADLPPIPEDKRLK
jgi:NitT/TauT family transport system substrate-binding protein/sulfonate transport system substrate-binding protein